MIGVVTIDRGTRVEEELDRRDPVCRYRPVQGAGAGATLDVGTAGDQRAKLIIAALPPRGIEELVV